MPLQIPMPPAIASLLSEKSGTKPFHWEKLQPLKFKNSLWDLNDLVAKQEQVLLTDDGMVPELKSVFSKAAAKEQTAAPKKVQQKALTCLETNRERNLGITLTYLRMDAASIGRAVDSLDDKFTTDIIEGLISVLPTREEMESAKAMLQELGGDTSKMSLPMKWVLQCSTMPLIAERLTSWLLLTRFDSNASQLEKEMEHLRTAADKLREGADSKTLAEFLGMSLAVGNLMNAGLARYGNSVGWRLLGEMPGGMSKLRDLRDNKNSTNLLNFLAKWATNRNKRFPLICKGELQKALTVAAPIAMADISACIIDLDTNLMMLAKALSNKLLGEGTPFHNKLEPFFHRARGTMDKLHAAKRDSELALSALAPYFAEDPGPFNHQDCMQQVLALLAQIERAVLELSRQGEIKFDEDVAESLGVRSAKAAKA